MAEQLDTKTGAVPTHKVEVSGLVADVTGTTLILNVGSKAGVKVGDMLEVSRPVKTIKDPSTGKVLKTISAKIGDAAVTEVDEQSATATFKGADTAKVGDMVKNPQ